jgi:hypothetical protein
MANRLRAPLLVQASSRPRKRGVFSRSGAAYSSVICAGLQAQLHVLRGVPVERGVQEGGIHAGLVQRAHLVVHQRDQRRHHDGHAVALRWRAMAGIW